MTLVGPHRDDLLLGLGRMPAKGYASHGESWSYALALRLASYDLLRADGIEPVLVLDDVFAELDTRRRERLAELVAPGEQVLVTAAVDDDVPEVLTGTRHTVSEARWSAYDGEHIGTRVEGGRAPPPREDPRALRRRPRARRPACREGTGTRAWGRGPAEEAGAARRWLRSGSGADRRDPMALGAAINRLSPSAAGRPRPRWAV